MCDRKYRKGIPEMFMIKASDLDSGKIEVSKLVEDFCAMMLDRVNDTDDFEHVKGLGGLVKALSCVSEKIDADNFFSEYSSWFEELVDAIRIYEFRMSTLDMSADDLKTLRKFGFIVDESDTNA